MTLALGLETHNNSNSGSSGSTDDFSSIAANLRAHWHTSKHIQINKSSTPNMINNLWKGYLWVGLISTIAWAQEPLKMEIGRKRYGLRKIYQEEGHFQVFHLKNTEINKIISIGGIKQWWEYILERWNWKNWIRISYGWIIDEKDGS